LAFALVPGAAVAEVGIPQYRDAPPTVTGKTTDGNSAPGANAGGGTNGSDQSSTPPGSDGGGKSKDGDGDETGGAAGGGDGKGKGGAAGGGAEKAGDEAGLPGTDSAQTSTDDGGSSPLVPILIALAVLAAISVGVVAMRKRREDAESGAPASPEAG
jgi:cobalamin biosynthesis Mg chelatase CobN